MKKYIRKIVGKLSLYEINSSVEKKNIIFHNVYAHNNRAIERGQIGKLTIEQANIALQYFNYRCAFSGEKFIKFTQVEKKKIRCSLSVEHIIALTAGGNSLAYNCVPSVLHYNLSKNVHHPLDWWKKQKNVNGEKIFNAIRLLKLVNYMMKSLKALEEQDIKKYKKIIMEPNEVDKYINENKKSLISNVKTSYQIKNNKIVLQRLPYNAKVPKLINKKIKLDLFLLDCIDLLEEYDIPCKMIEYLKKQFKELKEINKVFEKIPEEERIQREVIKNLKRKNIENVYTLARTINLEEIRKRKIGIDEYLEEKLKNVHKALEKNKINSNNVNILLDITPRIIESKEEQEIIIEMISNFKKSKNKDIKKYFLKLENRVEAEDKIFIESILKNVKENIKYLNEEEMNKLKKKLMHNPLSDRKYGRRLKNGYKKIYKELKKQEIKEPELSVEASKAYIYSKIGAGGFSYLQDNSKLFDEVKKKIIKNYKKGILELDFYLLENKQDKSVEEADKELTKEILSRVKPVLEKLDSEELNILKRRLSFNSKTCRIHGTRLINVYNRIYYALKKQGIKEPELSIEASKAYIYSKICQVGFYSIQCNDAKYKDKSIEKVVNNYEKEMEDIGYYLLDNKLNISKQQADEEITNVILENTKEITKQLNEQEKAILKKQLLKSYNYFDDKTNRLIVAYNKIYYELKKQGLKEPELSIETSKAYLYAKIAQVGFYNLLQRERKSIKENIIRILEEYEEGLKRLDFYLLNNRSKKNIEGLDKKLTEKILGNTKEVWEKLEPKEQEKLKEMLIKNSKSKGNKGIKLINAFNRIYCEMKRNGIEEPELTKEASKAYMYAKISEFGFLSLVLHDKKYTNKNLKILLSTYKEEIENIGYYLLDNQHSKSVVEADKELTNKVLVNIKEITDKLNTNEVKLLKEKLLANTKTNEAQGTRLINVYNKIYYAMRRNGMNEPKLTQEACKAYVYSKIFNVGFYSILKGSNKKRYIKNILDNYQVEIDDIDYHLLKKTTLKRVERDNQELVQFIIKNTQSIIKSLSKEEKQKLEEKLLYSIKSDLDDGIRQRNAFNRIYCRMKKDGIREPELTQETCKAYLYAKIGSIGFETLVRYTKKRTEINLEKVVKNYKQEIKKIDYYLIFERPNKPVKESDEELTEYVLKKAKDMVKNLSLEKQKILKEKLGYNMQACIKHGTRLRNAYNQILYALKKRGLREPELSIEASKAYIYSKVISTYFSSIIQNDKQYIEKNLNNIMNEYQEGIKYLDCYLHISDKSKNMQYKNRKLVKYILSNTEDILNQLTKEEIEKIKEKLLKKCDKNSYMPVFNRIYSELKRKGMKGIELTKKSCRVYLFGEIGPIGFSSILNNEKEYGNKNLKKIIEMTDEQIDLLDYYLLYDRKGLGEENIKLSEKVYLEALNYFPNLTQEQKTLLRKVLLKNDEKLRFINAYNKIYYALKKQNTKEPQLSIDTKRIYAYIKIRQKGFYILANNRIYSKNDLSEEKIKKYLHNFKQLDFYLLESYEEKSLENADKLLTKKVLEKSGILELLDEIEIKQIDKLLLKNSDKHVKLVTAYNRIYFALSKEGVKEPELTKEASKAYIYSKIAKCGFSEIQDNGKKIDLKIRKVIRDYKENIKHIKLYMINNEKQKDKSDIALIDKILENARDILEELDQGEKVKLKERLIYNANKGVKLVKVYNKIYYELIKKGLREPSLTQETVKAYIYAKIGPDGYCDIRDNAKSSKKNLEKIINHYSERIDKVKYYLLDFFNDKNVQEADYLLIKNIVSKTKNDLGELYASSNFMKSLNYNSQAKTKMVIVYNKIYFLLSKSGLREPELTTEASKAFVYAKIGPEGFKQIQNNNVGSDECVQNVIKYYKEGLEIMKQDYQKHKIDFSKRVLYKKTTIRKRIVEKAFMN